MFNFFKKKSDVLNEDQRKLKVLSDILYPPADVKVDEDGTKYYIDFSLDSNLQSVLSDLEDGINDEATKSTLRHIVGELYKVRDAIEAFHEIPQDVDFYSTTYKDEEDNFILPMEH